MPKKKFLCVRVGGSDDRIKAWLGAPPGPGQGLASKSENGDEGEPVAVLYRNAVAPGPISV